MRGWDGVSSTGIGAQLRPVAVIWLPDLAVAVAGDQTAAKMMYLAPGNAREVAARAADFKAQCKEHKLRIYAQCSLLF